MTPTPEIWNPSATAFNKKRLIIQIRYTATEDQCAICLETMHFKRCEYLPCKHAFHLKCVGQLMDRRTYTCPLCRYDFTEAVVGPGPGPGPGPIRWIDIEIDINMDIYDLILELLWHRYQIEA